MCMRRWYSLANLQNGDSHLKQDDVRLELPFLCMLAAHVASWLVQERGEPGVFWGSDL